MDQFLKSNHDEDIDEVAKAVGELMKRFDTVQVFATRYSPDDGGTVNLNQGQGNWFARYGHIREWLIRTEKGDKEDI